MFPVHNFSFLMRIQVPLRPPPTLIILHTGILENCILGKKDVIILSVFVRSRIDLFHRFHIDFNHVPLINFLAKGFIFDEEKVVFRRR